MPVSLLLAAGAHRERRRGSTATRLQRYTLIVGANFGGADRPVLKYGVSDAERFARVMVDLGGVSPEHNTILKQPKLRDLLDGLDLLTRRVTDASRLAGPGAARTEVIVYYSGHADEKGLLLGEDRYSYVSLRDRLDQIPADVRIAVLDACASGAFTRIKGGRARPPFLVDQSASMRGHAFLTSSAATEVAQESDRIRASYFTHYLVSGLRGAADLSGDGRITLNEAYQFAFSETLGRTVDSKGGAQHPSYDINMSGTGDVVMTDVRQLSATLVLGEEVEGRFFVRNAAQELIVEVYKPYGRTVALGVEPGAYEVRVEHEKTALLAKVSVADGGQLIVDRKQFNPTTVEPTRSRGSADVLPYAVEGRHRLELRLGMWRTSENPTVSPVVGTDDVVGGLQYTRYLKENLSITFAIEGLEVDRSPGDGAFSSHRRYLPGRRAVEPAFIRAPERWHQAVRGRWYRTGDWRKRRRLFRQTATGSRAYARARRSVATCAGAPISTSPARSPSERTPATTGWRTSTSPSARAGTTADSA